MSEKRIVTRSVFIALSVGFVMAGILLSAWAGNNGNGNAAATGVLFMAGIGFALWSSIFETHDEA